MPPMQAQQLDKLLPSKPTAKRLCMTFEREPAPSNLGRSEKVMYSLSQIQCRRPPRCADVHAYDGIYAMNASAAMLSTIMLGQHKHKEAKMPGL
jgi:hypothetical protein